MVSRLARRGFVSHRPYRDLQLTRRGLKAALRLVRRHRVIEAYLVAALGFTWDRVHQEAERLEHAASDDLVNRMAADIGEPAIDPHGAPIPTAHGAIREPPYRPLSELSDGEEARVARVEDEDAELLRHLKTLRLVPGALVRYVGREPFGGSLVIRVGVRTYSVGAVIAARVFLAAV
jgi:DtxR family Mn-dependent transcriptional regulator